MDAMPPMVMRVLFPMMAMTIGIAVSPIGRRFAELPILLLVGIHIFRFPLELMLHQLHLEGHLPREITYTGMNFDIVTGLGALAVVLWNVWGEVPRWALWMWNIIGSMCLVMVMGIAMAGVPKPLGFFDIPIVLPATFPFVWLPCFLVMLALFGHLIIFRHLRMTRVASLKSS